MAIPCLLIMNNYQKQLKQLTEIKGRPKLLLHICCGVCSVYPLYYLEKYFDITIFFSNSNIYPYKEYLKRLKALRQYLHTIEDKNIKLIIDGYDNQKYMEKIKEFADEPEGGKRCKICYEMRMKQAFIYASKHHYDYCTTVMSISNRKNALWLNEIGDKLQKKYPDVRYLYADFKKGGGIIANQNMNKQLNLYHQNYCGCIYSMKQNS